MRATATTYFRGSQPRVSKGRRGRVTYVGEMFSPMAIGQEASAVSESQVQSRELPETDA